MQVHFESPDPEAAQLRALAVQRLNFVMRRVRWLVPRVSVRLSDVHGPRGGIGKRCQVALKTEGAGTVVITAWARHWHGALEAALARASHTLLRHWRGARRPAGGQAPRTIGLEA